jgi:IS1 family transposase
MRIDPQKAFQVVHLLAEGVGIRACERLTGLNRHTVLAILETAGQKCDRLLDAKIRNVRVEQVQVDEIWAFVHCKQARAEAFAHDHGDQFTYLAVERTSKLILSHFVGKRTKENCAIFLGDLQRRTANRFQLSTDGFIGYIGGKVEPGAVEQAFGTAIDYGTEIKAYDHEVGIQRRYSPPRCTGVKRRARIGQPDEGMITTSHVERTNLSVRIFNRRFTRLTLGFSKKLANHKHAVAIFVAHFNFCRVHSAHGQTPAMASGLTDHPWSIPELLAEGSTY